jgi:hypothetical protein
MTPELFIPISCFLNKEMAKEVNSKLELVYKFAQDNMISFNEVPEYLSEILKNKKYASSAMKSSLSKLPDFIFKLADLKNDYYFIKTSQEKEQKVSDGSDSWTRSWWASILSFFPGVGGVISLFNIWNYSYKACTNEGLLSWACVEFAFDILTIILDVATIAGLVGAIASDGGTAAISAGSIATGTVLKSIRPLIRVLMFSYKMTSPLILILKKFGPFFIKILSEAVRKSEAIIRWLNAKKSASGVLGKMFTKLKDMFISFGKITKNMIKYLENGIKAEKNFLGASQTARGRGMKARRATYRSIKTYGQLEGQQILQWCSFFRHGSGWTSYFGLSLNSMRTYGLIGDAATFIINWFLSEGATDIENAIGDIEDEVTKNPNATITGTQMQEKIRLIVQNNAEKLAVKLRSEGRSEAEISSIKEKYAQYMIDLLGGIAITESENTGQNSVPGIGERGGYDPTTTFDNMWKPAF